MTRQDKINCLKEHKITVCGLGSFIVLLILRWVVGITFQSDNILIFVSMLSALTILSAAIFEWHRSRFTILRVAAYLLYAYFIISAILGGHHRWMGE